MENQRENLFRPLLSWKWILLIWVVMGLVSATTLYFNLQSIGRPTSWLSIFSVRLLVWLFWGAWAILIFKLARRFQFKRHAILWPLLIHFLFCFVSILINVGVYTSIAWGMGLDSFSGLAWTGIFKILFLGLADWYFFVYWSIVLVTYAFEFFQGIQKRKMRELQLESQVVLAQLQSLRMQLQPHFLFNTMNTIASMVRQEKPQKAIRMLSDLSGLLRISLAQKDAQLVSLEQEIKFTQHYLALEKERFGDKLKVRWEIPASLLNSHVPNFLLQPLVENAIKHGISKSLESKEVHIGASKVGNDLLLEIFNEGPALPANFNLALDSNIGLSTTMERLRQLYLGEATFKIKNKVNGVVVEVQLPLNSIE